MTQLFRTSGDGTVICDQCLPDNDRLFAVELDPRLFPDTYDRLRCASCGALGSIDRPRDRQSAIAAG